MRDHRTFTPIDTPKQFSEKAQVIVGIICVFVVMLALFAPLLFRVS